MGHLGHDHEGHSHQHIHTGEDGRTFTHAHQHDHEGEHRHEHDDAQAFAVLQYMLEHNIHHAKELSDLAAHFDGEARHQLLHAVDSFDQANGYLSGALEELKKQRP